MFFKKNDKDKMEQQYLELREETRENVKPVIQDLVTELVGHMQISAKTDLWSKEEFEAMVGEMIKESADRYKSMDPSEILDDLTERKMKKLGAKVIEVRI